jgi:hypothetical protein
MTTGTEPTLPQFKNTGSLKRDDWTVAEFETDKKQYPKQVGKLYIDGNWFDVAQARELRDFLNEVLP